MARNGQGLLMNGAPQISIALPRPAANALKKSPDILSIVLKLALPTAMKRGLDRESGIMSYRGSRGPKAPNGRIRSLYCADVVMDRGLRQTSTQ